MPGSSEPQDAASMRKLESGPRAIRAKARAYPLSKEPGKDARLHAALH